MNIQYSIRFLITIAFYTVQCLVACQDSQAFSIVKITLSESLILTSKDRYYDSYKDIWNKLGIICPNDNEIPVMVVDKVLYCEDNNEKNWRTHTPQNIVKWLNKHQTFPRLVPVEMFFDEQSKILKQQIELKIAVDRGDMQSLIIPVDETIKSMLIPTMLIDKKETSFVMMVFLFVVYLSRH